MSTTCAGEALAYGYGRGRTLHLVDVENLMGEAHKETADTPIAFKRFLEAAGWRTGDHVVVAGQVGHLAFLSFANLVSYRSLLAYVGPDGADRKLTEHDTAEHIARRFGRVTIGSGDHHFTPLASELRARGVHVVVACLPRSLHHTLHCAADEYLPIEEIDLRDPAAENDPPLKVGRSSSGRDPRWVSRPGSRRPRHKRAKTDGSSSPGRRRPRRAPRVARRRRRRRR